MKNMCFSLDVCKKYVQNMEVPRFGRTLGGGGQGKASLLWVVGGRRREEVRRRGEKKTEPSPRGEEKMFKQH